MTDLVDPVSAASAPCYIRGDVCNGWRLLDHDQLSVIEERIRPGAGDRVAV